MAAYLINQTPSKLLGGKTPYEIIYQTKPTYEHVKVFGSLYYAKTKGVINLHHEVGGVYL